MALNCGVGATAERVIVATAVAGFFWCVLRCVPASVVNILNDADLADRVVHDVLY